MHEKATDYCMNQEKELMEIKDQYLKLEKEHAFVMNQFKLKNEEMEKI